MIKVNQGNNQNAYFHCPSGVGDKSEDQRDDQYARWKAEVAVRGMYDTDVA